jgi:hypothetical protein
MKMRITRLKASWCNKLGEGGRGLSMNYIKGMLIFDRGNAIELSFSFEYPSVIWVSKCC